MKLAKMNFNVLIATATLFVFGMSANAQQMDGATQETEQDVQQDIQQNAQQGARQDAQQQQTADFSEQQIEDFVSVVKVQQEGEMEMVQAIQDQGLDLQQFNQILQAHQSPDATETDISEEEMQKFDKASQQVIEIQQEMQTEVMQAINDTDLGVQTYQEILNAYQTDPQVQQKVDQMLTR